MKKILVVACMLLTVSTAAVAQKNPKKVKSSKNNTTKEVVQQQEDKVVAAQNDKTFGTAFELNKSEVITPARLDVLMKDVEKLDNVTMSGYVNQVCKKEGCWIRLSSTSTSGENLMVKMKDHAFTLPKDIDGQQAIVRGYVVKKVVSVAEQRHYLEDAKAPQAEIDKITEPKTQYQFIASGVILN